MTEDEWLESRSPHAMLELLQHNWRAHRTKVGRRRHRLFGCACCARIVHVVNDPNAHALLFALEAYADGVIDKSKMEQARQKYPFRQHTGVWEDDDVDRLRFLLSEHSPEYFASEAFQSLGFEPPSDVILCGASAAIAYAKDRMHEEIRYQSKLLRDIFGNPFRSVTLDPRWQSSTVLDLARTIYDQRTFEIMPILGDALMDAGCDSEEIIAHCQGPGPHVRGCWVVDLILGRS